ncbi:MAG: TPR end-of-group domain-containing protein [Acidimicrobiales bacterium]
MVALVAAIGTLVMLVVGADKGRPQTALPFAYWVGCSIVVLVITGWQWSRRFFVGFAIVVLLLLMLLTAEFGETTRRTQQVTAAASTSALLAARLADTERIAIGLQLKALGPFIKATSPPTPPLLLDPASRLASELRGVRGELPASPSEVAALDAEQQVLATAIGPTSSTASPPALDVTGPALSLRWEAYFAPATTAIARLCHLGAVPEANALARVCSGSPSSGSATTPARLTQDVASATAGVAAAAQEVSPSTANSAALSSAQAAEDAAFTTPAQNSSNFPDDLSFGINELVATVEGATPGSSWWNSPLTAQAWIVVGLLILFGIRWLLVLNNRNGWGPIELVAAGAGSSSKPASSSKKSPTADTKASRADSQQSAAADADGWVSTIRSYVVQNVPEPASLPGTTIVREVTTLATTSSLGVPTWVGMVFKVVAWALFPPSGYRVELDFRSMSNPNDASVVIRLGPRGRPKTLYVDVVGPYRQATQSVRPAAAPKASSPQPDPLDPIMRDTGYWIAGWILSNCKLVPPWATWPQASGPDLGEYMSVNSEMKTNVNPTARAVKAPRALAPIEQDLTGEALAEQALESIRCLENARGKGRESSLILFLLAEKYEFREEFANALELYLQVVLLCPRYYVARYRVAVTLSLLTSGDLNCWTSAVDGPDCQALRIVRLLQEIDGGRERGAVDYRRLREYATKQPDPCADPLMPTPAHVGRQTDRQSSSDSKDCGGIVQCMLVELAAHHVNESVMSVNFAIMSFKALRREERRYWLTRMRTPVLIRRNLKSAMPSITQLEACTVEQRPTHSTVKGWTYARSTSAQVFYNLACYYAKRCDGEKAVTLLEQAVLRPYADQIDAAWMRRDPDLTSLRVDAPPDINARFEGVLALLDGSSPVGETSEVPPQPLPATLWCLVRFVSGIQKGRPRTQKLIERAQTAANKVQGGACAFSRALEAAKENSDEQGAPRKCRQQDASPTERTPVVTDDPGEGP